MVDEKYVIPKDCPQLDWSWFSIVEWFLFAGILTAYFWVGLYLAAGLSQ